MNNDAESLNIRIRDVVEYAQEHDSRVSYETVLDILKDKNDSVSQDDLDRARREIVQKGIQITGEDEEERYSGDLSNPGIFVPADVRISQIPLNIYNLMERLQNNEINLQPDYQRKRDLWTEEKQSQLIESLLLKIPLPTFYFDAQNEDRWVVIDGLQRLSAIYNYLVGDPVNGLEDEKRKKKAFTGLQYLEEFNDKTFDELPRQYVRRVKEASIVAYVVEKGTPDAVVFNIFQRINTGSLPLSDQEIRQALHQGHAIELTKELAESEEFKMATQYKISSERLMDREYVTRYLAFTELDYEKEYDNGMDDYLTKALDRVNRYEENELNRIRGQFLQLMRDCYTIFGKYTFRRYDLITHRRGPISKAIFELWVICFSQLNREKLNSIKENKDRLVAEFGELLKNHEFSTSLNSGKISDIRKRVRSANSLLGRF
ncbi:MAG: DUF262 domain-containing protein [Lachnospiraceae bacterium]|nr:DUF262 domain-containing protein [Lachnospiraceae bacterium]